MVSITDELREYVRHYSVAGSSKDKTLTAIADRIDAAHCKALGETAAAAYAEGAESVPIAVDENAWVRLPVDADGVTIHGGDKMCSMNGDVLGRVTGIGVCERTGWVWILRNGRNVSTGCDATTLRHHHAPTVEDVLTEFGIDWEHESDCEDRAALLAEYAAKLRLAGDGE